MWWLITFLILALKCAKIWLKRTLDATFLDCLALTFCDVIDELLPEWACLILQGGTTFLLTSKLADIPFSHWRQIYTQNLHVWGNVFSLLRQECPPILTSGEMLSHPGGWDKPIQEVIHLWRHRTSTPNNLGKSRLGCVLDIFCTFWDKNEKNNQTPHWGRDSGIPSSCLRFATSTTRQASSWIANLRHSEGIPSSLPQCGVRFY